jgi:hypothetical protein
MSITADEARELIKTDDDYLKHLEELKKSGEASINTAIHLKRRYAYTQLHRNNQSHWEDIITYWRGLGYIVTYRPNAGGEMVPSRMEW